ncbi:hypothetical protein J8281_16295 [Aquimarina sp. U1-2]|uniref:hypothetical protein n=1 Tax=Aquimarina sp. U1-2 TaxID=2823141 RepID=UPI001AED0FB6|nr:hypothetical protein [Aquimarina sp. U1-2]MBP2833757.1 hypothetical protein [Aquimarina sp. U1-2]
MKRNIVIVSIVIVLGAFLTSCDEDTYVSASDEENILDEQEPLGLVTNYGVPLYPYLKVNKTGDYFRRIFLDSITYVNYESENGLPDGSLIVMETWSNGSQSSVFYRTKVNGEWLNGSFAPSSPDFSAPSEIVSCNSCHMTAENTDYTYTLPRIAMALENGAMEIMECDVPPLTPCDLEAYAAN